MSRKKKKSTIPGVTSFSTAVARDCQGRTDVSKGYTIVEQEVWTVPENRPK